MAQDGKAATALQRRAAQEIDSTPYNVTGRRKKASGPDSLTNDQSEALSAVRAWHRSPRKQVFRLFGFAGTGKSTLIPRIREEVGGDVAVVTPTGKAASRLYQFGVDARTVHSLIYGQPTTDKDGKLHFSFKRERIDADAIILDECSMVGAKLGSDLVRLGIPILAIGDPYQLPPINGPAFFEGQPDALLRQITRQSKGSPVIDIATRVREGNRLALGEFGTSKVIKAADLSDDELLACDQIIAGCNATCRSLTKKIRRMLGRRSPLPERGDRIICLRNDWPNGLLNGQQFVVRDVGRVKGNRMTVALQPEDGAPPRIQTIETDNFHVPQPDMRRVLAPFSFSNCITCHKSQGSQWPNVLVIDESQCFGEYRNRWLYTAITRASDSITIVRGF